MNENLDLLTAEERKMLHDVLNGLNLENNLDKADAVYEYIIEWLGTLECIINRYSAE